MTNSDALEILYLFGRCTLRLDDVTEALTILSDFAPGLKVPLRQDDLIKKWSPAFNNTNGPSAEPSVEESKDA